MDRHATRRARLGSVSSGSARSRRARLGRYLCHDCGKSFSANLGFEKRKYDPTVVTRALGMRFSGTSLRAICCNLAQDGIFVRPRTVLN